MCVTAILLLALIGLSSVEQGHKQPFQDPPADRMFPDGRVYDFGKAARGTKLRHAFRIVNTSNVPLRIISLRFG